MVNQDGVVIVPHEATIVLLNEPTKGQDGWASLQEKNPRVDIEPKTSTSTTSVAVAGPLAVTVRTMVALRLTDSRSSSGRRFSHAK